VRAVGELLENQFRIGLVRMERAIKEKMSVYQEMSTAMPHDLVNAKPVMACDPGIFRIVAVVPVHGPDQSAVGGINAQAASLRSWAGRVCRVSGLGSKCATFTRRTTDVSARLKRRKVRTSA